jgi:pyrroloquinoline quinone biosynthesis protein D
MGDWATATPTRRGQAWVRRASEDTAVFNTETETLHLLNTSALAIWELCNGSTTGKEMAEAVAELTDLDIEAASVDVAIALDELAHWGLIDA